MSSRAATCRTAGLAAGAFAVMAATSQPSVDSLHWKRRVLILSAPDASDPVLAAQRRMLAGWKREAADRDITTVELVGNAVRGASDSAHHLRSRYRIKASAFGLVLVGKDGLVAERSIKPIPPAELQGIIDAMPMRRAGER